MINNVDFGQEWIASALGLGDEPRAQVIGKKQGWGRLQHGDSIVGQPLCLDGQTFERGFGTHADSEIAVGLPSPGRRFQALVGVDDNSLTRTAAAPCRLEFALMAGEREIYLSPVLSVGDAPLKIDIDLAGEQNLTLKAREVEGALALAHADWVNVQVELEDGTDLPLSRSREERRLLDFPPISFQYDKRPASELLPMWTKTTCSTPLNDDEILHRVTYEDADSGLQCIVEMKQFADFPAAEWVVRFKNNGTQTTPILEEVQALDFIWANAGQSVLLHRSLGSHGQIEDFNYAPEYLFRGDTGVEMNSFTMNSAGGRSSQDWLPFFNVQGGDEGFIAAIGWTGEWKAQFQCLSANEIRATAGMDGTHLKLLPGEEIRTPSILLLFWEGDVRESHNLLRRFLLKYHSPQQNGQPATVPICSATWGGMKTASHLRRLEDYRKLDLSYDCYWVDAGWYGINEVDCPDVFTGDWAMQTGNWNVNRYRHPDGLRPISDAAHELGLKYLLWFEPERAICGTALHREHPEWFLGEDVPGGSVLLDFGNADARQWVVDMVSGHIEKEGLDWYRQDFNFDPLPYWRAADTPDRQGISEIRHIEGLYAFWDALRERFPALMIDNCASGGRRLDLETIGRSIALWRSDYQCFPGPNPDGAQVQMLGLSHWLPLHAGGSFMGTTGDTYAFRSAMGAGIADQLFIYETDNPDEEYDWEWHRRALDELNGLRPYFHGDFYALTPCSPSPETWCAYQMHRPDLGEGFVLAFRRAKSPFQTAELKLGGLEAKASYQMEDADSGESWTATGSDLLSSGLSLSIESQRACRLIRIRKL